MLALLPRNDGNVTIPTFDVPARLRHASGGERSERDDSDTAVLHMTIKKPGRHAETLFAMLCAEYGATCNRATEDERGWDYFVQFARRPSPELPLDMAPEAEKCLAQIKATSRSAADVRLKLSNALEFATSDTPCFVILFRHIGRISTVHVLHFWQEEISRTLRRVRELDSQGRRDLHRFTIHFSSGSMQRLRPKELLAYLESTIRHFGTPYGDKKRDICTKVGFENVAVEGHISFRKGVTLDELIDVQIGLKDTIEITDFTARSVRFGIPAAAPFVSGSHGHGSIRSNPKKCIVRVSSERRAREISLPSDLYVPTFPDIPKEKLRFRIANPFIQLVFHVSESRLNFISRWNDSDQRSLEDLAAVLDLIHIFGSGRVHIRVGLEGKLLGGGFGETTAFEITSAIEALDKFVRFLRAQISPHELPDDFQLSLRDLFNRAYDIAQHNVLAIESSIEGSCTIEWSAEPHTGPAKLIYSVSVELPKYVVHTIVRRNLEIQQENEERFSLLWKEIDYTRVRVLQGSRESTKNIIAEEIKTTAQEIPGHLIVTLQDYRPDTVPDLSTEG